jgi:hypothetical protein
MILLRCGRVPIERLQLATAEVAAFIPAEKTHLLKEIYRVAREEEKYRLGEIPASSKVMVASSAEISPASDDGVPSPHYPDRVMAHSRAGVSQLGIPHLQPPPFRPRSAQPSYPLDEPPNNQFNPNSMPPAKRQKMNSPQSTGGQQVLSYADMYHQQYYPLHVGGQHQPSHALAHSQSGLIYPAHGGHNLRYQPEIKSAPPGQQQFFVLPPDFPSPPPTGGFHTTFPHDPPHNAPTSHAQHPPPQSPSGLRSYGAAYVAAQQLSSLRETTLQPSSSSTSNVPEPQPTPQHASTSSNFLNPRSSPYLPTPLRASGVPGTGESSGPNVSFSEFLNSPMTGGPLPSSDGALARFRRGEKRSANDDECESSDDEGTIDGNQSPSKKVA